MIKANLRIIAVAASKNEAGSITEIPKLGKWLDFPKVGNGEGALFQLSFSG